MTLPGYTHVEVPKGSLALFNQLKAEEAGRRNEGWITSEEFFKYLCFLYKQVRDDDRVRTLVMEKLRKEKEALAK